MSSFSQWFVSYQKTKSVKQVTWVCGTEPVLMEDIVSTLASHFSPDPWCLSTFVAGEDSEKEIWADLDQYPVDGKSPRLVVVRRAEQLESPERLVDWIATKNTNPLTSVVFLANTPELQREEQTAEQRRDRKKPELVPHLKAVQGKGSLIECKPFTQSTAKHAVTWVQTKVDIRRGIAGKLLERANGDLRLTRDAVRKLSAFPEEVTEQTINLLFSAQPRMSFVDALLVLDKPAASLALEHLPADEYSRTLGMLDQRLEVVGTVRDMLVSRSTTGQITAALGNMGFLAKDLIPMAKTYDPKRRDYLRTLLARTDHALRSGITVGPLESLVALW